MRAEALQSLTSQGIEVDASRAEPSGPASAHPSSPCEGRHRMCHVFAGGGPMMPGGMADIAAAKGIVCDEWDVRQDAVHGDLLLEANQLRLVADCEELGYAHLHAGIPCSTFSPILCMRGRQLRLRSQPWGRDGLAGEGLRRVGEADELIRATLAAAYVVFDLGGEVTLENVADRGDPDTPAWWPARAAMCPLALHPLIIAAMRYMGMVRLCLPMCALNPGGPQKWIELFATSGAAHVLRHLVGAFRSESRAFPSSMLQRVGHTAKRAITTHTVAPLM